MEPRTTATPPPLPSVGAAMDGTAPPPQQQPPQQQPQQQLSSSPPAAQQQQQQPQHHHAAAAAVPSIYKVSRELRREQHTLFNCLASILADAAFVQEIHALYAQLPCLANLRAGAWYAPSPDGACYFKSTDGHQNNCNFSVTRLNWHVAELAAQRGGAIIVDATRKGKRFPDAMTKTIPIWAAVINRAVARVRAYDAHKEQRRRTYAGANGDVLTQVADTQTSISERRDGAGTAASSDSSSRACAAGLQPAAANEPEPEQQQQQQQQHLEQSSQRESEEQHACAAGSQAGAQAGASPGSHCNSTTQVLQLLVECSPMSVDLMSGVCGGAVDEGAWAGAAASTGPASAAAAPPGPPPPLVGDAVAPAAAAASVCSSSPTAAAAAARSMQRSKSVHLSPQPSLHEWLDEMDILRRLTLLGAAGGGGGRGAASMRPRVSCPSSGGGAQEAAQQHPSCCSVGDAGATPAAAAAALDALYGSSAPAVSCLVSVRGSDEQPAAAAAGRVGSTGDDEAPGTPRASGCTRPLLLDDPCGVDLAPAGRCGGVPVQADDLDLPLLRVASREAPSPPAFMAAVSAAADDPATPRLAFSSAASSGRTASSSSDDSSSSSQQQPCAVPTQQQRSPRVPLAATGGNDAGPCGALDFAFPSPQQLAASAGSPVAGEGGSGRSSISSSTNSALVCPDMPVVVLNGTSHQAGDAASILDIWRGTDLEDMACLPGLSDFQPGVLHHVPDSCRAHAAPLWAGRSSSDDGEERLGAWQQQQQQAGACPAACPAADGSGGGTGTSGEAPASSWAAQVCLHTTQQLCGRMSVSNWLDDDDAAVGLGCDGLSAFAAPAAAGDASRLSMSAADGDGEADAAAAGRGGATTGDECTDGGAPGSSTSGHYAGSTCSSASSSSGGGGGAAVLSSSPASVGGASARGGAPGSQHGSAAADAPADAPADAEPWDTALHLPLWVAASEAAAIEAKLDAWVERLLEVGADVRSLAAVLSKPLRPLWVSQSSLIWTNQVADPSSLPFIPLLLVSASQQQAGERQAVRSSWLSLTRGGGCSPQRPLTPAEEQRRRAGGSDDDSSTTNSSDESDDASDDGLSSLAAAAGSSYGSSNGARQQRRASPRSKQQHRLKAHARRGGKAPAASLSYIYVPGAGDDEESWAAGLTPGLFWAHADALLRCGPSGIRAGVRQLLQLQRNPACSSVSAAVALRGMADAACGGARLQPAAGGRAALTDRHHHAPQGCVTGGAQQLAAAGPGAFWIGRTGLALGNLQGATAVDVWRSVDAVLCCGTAMVPALRSEYAAMRLAATSPAPTPLAALSSSAGAAPTGARHGPGSVQEASKLRRTRLQLSSSFCTSDAGTHDHWLRQQQLLAGQDGNSAAHQQPELSTVCASSGAAAVKRPARKGGMLSALFSGAKPPASASSPPQAAAAVAPSVDQACWGMADADAAATHHALGSSAGSTCSSSSYHSCSEVAAAGPGGVCGAGSSTSRAPQLPPLKWLPIEHAKRNRSSLKAHLQEALEFVSAHLAAGHTVLLHDMEGHDNCVCLAVAVLLGCFSAPDGTTSPTADGLAPPAAAPAFVGAWQPAAAGGQQQPQTQVQPQQQLPVEPVSKQSVRQRLALVSSCYPLARPTRGMLKQIFSFFNAASS